VTWGYHIMGSLQTCMSWGVSENWLDKNPALDVVVKSPAKRTVAWTPEQAASYIAKATELGWHSLAAMAWVYDSTAQSPIDVRLLKRGDYDGRGIGKPREKTGVSGAAIPLFPDAKVALDAYLATKPAMLPEVPLCLPMTGSGGCGRTAPSARPMTKSGPQPGCLRSFSCRTSAGPPRRRRVRQGPQLTRYGDLRDTPPAQPPSITSTPIAGSWIRPRAKGLQVGTYPVQKSERLTSNVRIAWGAVAERLKAAVC
jgi:hypothetical protein